jgi:chaperonin GroES
VKFVATEQLEKYIDSINIARDLDEDTLKKIGDDVVRGFDVDIQSRSEWERNVDTWIDLAKLVSEKKTYPWPGAANIKYPLLATAAMQFAARAYPSLIPSNNNVVKCRVVGSDPDGQKADRAKRISKYMSYQVMDEMPDWEEEMDKLLITLPIVGTCFKKTYWDSERSVNCSKLIPPKQLVINYWARSVEDAERITEWFPLSERKLKEKQLADLYLDITLQEPSAIYEPGRQIGTSDLRVPEEDETTPYYILEQHTYLDLDKDGYAEPYIVTVEYGSKKVLRIVARYTSDGVVLNEDGKLCRIEPVEYYTKFPFIPNPDGSIYDLGFGRLLCPINESVNTLLNLLVDSGALSNLQAGFIGKGLKIKMGSENFRPGEWKAVNAIGDDLKKQIFPLPVREPSEVLFKLLDLLVKSGKELASVAEIFVGKMPGQNTPATTTMATIEQGMKVFTAVYKRVFRAMSKEFRKIYKLNRDYANPEEYIDVIDEQIQQSDFEGPENDIIPAADPQAATSTEKQAKVESLLQLMGLGTLDPNEVTKRALEAQEQPNIEALFRKEPPAPDPKVQAIQMKAQLDQQKGQNDIQIAQMKAQMEQASKEQELIYEQRIKELELKFKAMEAMLKMRASQAEANASMQQQAQQHSLNMATQHEAHQMNAQHTSEMNSIKQQQAKAKPKTTPNK